MRGGVIVSATTGAGKARLDFEQLAKLEPRLLGLLDEARGWHKRTPKHFCANAKWYGHAGRRPGIKGRLARLVGWQAPADAPALFRTADAYEVAYETLYEALPGCRAGCACRVVRGVLVGN